MMRALYFDKAGSLDNLRVQDLPVPRPRQGEALVRVAAAAVNPSDVKIALGEMPMVSAPRVPGRDFAGEVIDGPSEWQHKMVFGTGGNLGVGRDGSHAEYMTVPAEGLVELPAALGFVDATACSLGYLTAEAALRQLPGEWQGTILLVTGATGTVGSAAARVAASQGARVLGTAKSDKDLADRPDLPDIEWIDLSAEPMSESVRHLTDGKGTDTIVDVVGGPLFEECLASLAPRGRYVVLSSVGEPRVSFDLVDFYRRESTLTGLNTMRLSIGEAAEVLRTLLPGFEEGLFTPPPVQEITLDDAADAYWAVNNRSAPKKFVITFDGPRS
jgi:NADPH2:quinone reductase